MVDEFQDNPCNKILSLPGWRGPDRLPTDRLCIVGDPRNDNRVPAADVRVFQHVHAKIVESTFTTDWPTSRWTPTLSRTPSFRREREGFVAHRQELSLAQSTAVAFGCGISLHV